MQLLNRATAHKQLFGMEIATYFLMRIRSVYHACGGLKKASLGAFFTLAVFLSACYRPIHQYIPWQISETNTQAEGEFHTLVATPTLSSDVSLPARTSIAITPTAWVAPKITSTLAAMAPTPTPRAAIELPPLRTTETIYTVQSGDSLANIALRHQVSVNQLLEANDVKDPNLISVGQVLKIPPSSANEMAGNLILVPDSELVYGPDVKDFDIESFIAQFNGVLKGYKQVDDENYELTGPEVVRRVAEENSFNPRLLLALLEFKSGWLTQESPSGFDEIDPLGLRAIDRKGLYKQLSWIANEVMRGSAFWKARALSVWTLADGSVMRIDPQLNAGTAGLQYALSLLFDKEQFKQAIGKEGLLKVYQTLFGDPFAFTNDHLVPADLKQPEWMLPFETGDEWFYTGGPHWGWGSGSLWAAIDFAPPSPDDEYGCFESRAPVLAVADGRVVRSGFGSVVLDFDGDGLESTGWSLLYMHIATQDRAALGVEVKQGDLIGYASCEGGISTGTHIHLARKYNGVWIPAYGDSPFVLGGWVISSAGSVYDGYMERNGETIEAYNGRADFNTIRR